MKLGLFFTRGISLHNWVETGILGREVEYYLELSKRLDLQTLTFFTYDLRDVAFQDELAEEFAQVGVAFEIKPMRSGFGGLLSFLAVNNSHLRALDIYKSNQMLGAATLLICAKLFGKAAYVRSGYVPSKYLKARGKMGWVKSAYHWLNEAFIAKFADFITVSSRHDQRYFEEMYRCKAAPMVLRNFADFKPRESTENAQLRPPSVRDEDFLFVGRLEREKNVENLVLAFNQLGLPLTIVGKGSLAAPLKALAQDNVRFLDRMPHEELRQRFEVSRYFVLPSIVEGMPKVLIEAMLCRCLCIGSPTPGIEEFIVDGKSGYLMQGYSTEDIISAVERAQHGDIDALAHNAQSFVTSNFSRDAVVEGDADIIRGLYARTA
jgi:glycosyltransferase involved in cell wall biosynthesis